MSTIADYLRNDHNHCERLFTELEISVNAGLWDRADATFQQFHDALDKHFEMEEKVLFVAFENTVAGGGPTAILRNEHQQIRGIVAMLEYALTRRSRNAFLGHSDTLYIMIHRHNAIEENTLYQMTDHILFEQKQAIIEAMSKIRSALADSSETSSRQTSIA